MPKVTLSIWKKGLFHSIGGITTIEAETVEEIVKITETVKLHVD